MSTITATFHRTKTVSIFPQEADRFLIVATLQDEVHDVQLEVEILHPSLEIVAARSEIRGGPFTAICNMTHPNAEQLVGLRVERGFTKRARGLVGGPSGCHRISELAQEVAQAAYQLHFVRYFSSLPRDAPDVPTARRKAVLESIPGMRNTCFSYHDDREALVATHATPLQLRKQAMPVRKRS